MVERWERTSGEGAAERAAAAAAVAAIVATAAAAAAMTATSGTDSFARAPASYFPLPASPTFLSVRRGDHVDYQVGNGL